MTPPDPLATVREAFRSISDRLRYIKAFAHKNVVGDCDVRDALVTARREERSTTWEEAAKEHQRHCVSFGCRENKTPCNEYETYMRRATDQT